MLLSNGNGPIKVRSMNTTQQVIPSIAVRSIGGGLLLMALFTMMWTGIAQSGLRGHDHSMVLITFSVLSVIFVIFGITLFIAAKRFPKFTNEGSADKGRNMLKWFGIIFGIEFTAIPLVSVVLFLLKDQQFVLPAIALIVGLHFYPMAKVFNRKIDYYLATWTCIIAIASIVITAGNSYSQALTLTFLGIGVALATTFYGVYMLLAGYKLIKQ